MPLESNKKKRVITDRRREQNKAAQKTYRDKVRNQLQRSKALQQSETLSSPSSVGTSHVSVSGSEDRSQPNEPSTQTLVLSGSRDLLQNSSLDISTLPLRERSSTLAQCIVIRPYVSDPRLNHLSDPHISLISAGVENCLSFNVTKGEALTVGFPSPFYDSDFVAGINTSTPDWWTSIPRDLHPTALQRTVPHQVWIDSIPVPSFRDAVLTLLATGRNENPQFHLMELANDIDDGGLVCWGGQINSPNSTGTPWDSRSWEARPGFLTKWKHVTGGLEGELGRMSMWWWRLKGERFA